MKIIDKLEYPWDTYAALQEAEDKITTVGHRERAGDDKLNVVLESIAKGTLPVETEVAQKQLVNLEVNRQKKYRNREIILARWANTYITEYYKQKDMVSAVEIDEQVESVRLTADHQEWRILWALACDRSYASVAKDENLTETVLKARVSRLRSRLKQELSHYN